MTDPYDAILVVSFGGPEGPEDVMPFLENTTRGRGVPRERLEEVAHHYMEFGGVSPINAQNRALIEALERRLAEAGPRLPVYLGNRNWHPLLPDTLRRMRDDGIGRALGFFTSAYSSWSGCRQYLENIEAARAAAGPGAPTVDKLRAYFNHPGFVEPMADSVRAARHRLPGAKVVFCAHSIPRSMAAVCDYQRQLAETSRLVAGRAAVAANDWDLAYQSRSGAPSVPWLEPDVVDHLDSLRAAGVRDVVLAPIGFISDHMEVMYDLDTEAAEHARAIGIRMVRAATAGTDPRFVEMIRELVLERTEGAPKRWLGDLGPWPDTCPANCCPAGR